jgi:hypothetical protein
MSGTCNSSEENQCHECGMNYCAKAECDECGMNCCAQCVACQYCGSVFCKDCEDEGWECVGCGEVFCWSCFTDEQRECASCGELCCSQCRSDEELCPECEPEESL